MAEGRVEWPSFSKGEIGPQLYGRYDVGAYATGVKRARNVCVLKYGGLTKRPGTRFVGEVKATDDDVRLLPFQFSLEQAYVLEMGQAYMRPVALGGQLLEEELVITGITNEATAKVTAAYHAYAVGDDVYFQGVAGMTEINGRIGRVTAVVDTNNFRVGIDTTGYGVFTSATGGITRTGAPTPTPTPTPPAPPADPYEPPETTGGGYYGLGPIP